MKQNDESNTTHSSSLLNNPMFGHEFESAMANPPEPLPKDYPTGPTTHDSQLPQSVSHAEIVNDCKRKGQW